MKKRTRQYALSRGEQKAIQDFFQEKGLPLDKDVAYADVGIPEHYSDIRSRAEIADFSVLLTPKLNLNIPFVSANMEPVSGAEMITAVEREGGLGLPPQSLSIRERVDILERVLRTDCAVIDNPLTVLPNETLREAKEKMTKLRVSGAVVVDAENNVCGILSSRDWRYEEDDSKTVEYLMTSTLTTAPHWISLREAGKILRNCKIEKLPLIHRGNKLKGLITARGLFYNLHYPRALRDDRGRFVRAGTVGVSAHFSEKHLKEVEAQMEKGISVLLIDTARAFSVNTGEAIREVKKRFKIDVIVGNISTPEGAKFLFEAGADCVKIGQGPGEVCRTREVGVGVPQLTAVAMCAAIAKRYGKTVIADGGIKSPGDIAKALIAGANAVMLGYLLAGTEESASPAYAKDSSEFGTELRVKDYYGSASFEAQKLRLERGGLDYARRPEGVKMIVPVVGTVAWRIGTLLDGLRSAMSYCGARTVSELQEKGRFRLQTRAGLVEGTKKA